MREISKVRDETIKGNGGSFLIDKVLVEIDGEQLFWWKVYFWGGRMSGGKQFIAHAPTKKDAMFQLESIRKNKHFAKMFWNDEDFKSSEQRKEGAKYRFKELLNELLALLPEIKIK